MDRYLLIPPGRGPLQDKGVSPNRPGKATGDISLLLPVRKLGLEQDFPGGVEVGSEGDQHHLKGFFKLRMWHQVVTWVG